MANALTFFAQPHPCIDSASSPLLALALVASSRAATYDAVHDYNLVANPNGVWSYGTLSSLTGGTFTPFSTPAQGFLFAAELEWCADTQQRYEPSVATSDTDPSTKYVLKPNGYFDRSTYLEFSPDELLVWGNTAIATVRWTAPAAGTYHVTGYFRDLHTGAYGTNVSIVRNGKTLQQNTVTISAFGAAHFFAFNTGDVPAGTTFDFADLGKDAVGLTVTISDDVPNFAAVGLVHTDGDGNVHNAETDLNAAARTFVTDFKGVGDVTITELAGQVRDVTKDDFSSTRQGNNPTYLATFLGSPGNGTGDGHQAGLYLLRTRPNLNIKLTSLQFQFDLPLTTSDRILITDVDGQEQYEIHAYHNVNGVEKEISQTNWQHQSFTGSTGVGGNGDGDYPDKTWAAWDPDAHTLTSQAQSSTLTAARERLDVLTPDTTKVDRLVFTTTQLMAGDDGAGIQIIHVPGSVPTITSATTAAATQGQTFSYQIKASNGATAYDARGLPAGLALSGTTPGLITGTPTAYGTFAVTLEASNAEGSALATLTLTVKEAAPAISSPGTATATVGKAFFYKITATHSPTRFGVVGLPAGLSINPTTGVISGTPTKAGTFTLTLKAINGGGTGQKTLTLTVNPG